jgi:hypothetical protein
MSVLLSGQANYYSVSYYNILRESNLCGISKIMLSHCNKKTGSCHRIEKVVLQDLLLRKVGYG